MWIDTGVADLTRCEIVIAWPCDAQPEWIDGDTSRPYRRIIVMDGEHGSRSGVWLHGRDIYVGDVQGGDRRVRLPLPPSAGPLITLLITRPAGLGGDGVNVFVDNIYLDTVGWFPFRGGNITIGGDPSVPHESGLHHTVSWSIVGRVDTPPVTGRPTPDILDVLEFFAWFSSCEGATVYDILDYFGGRA